LQIVTLNAVKAAFTFTLVVLPTLAAGCNGLIGSHGGGGGGGGGATTGQLCVQGAAPPSTRVRRLTKLEIQRSATAVLGIDVTSALANLDSDSAVNGTFSNSDGLVVSDSFASGLNLAAEAIGTSFKATVTRTTYGATCFSSDGEAATCAETFIRDTGRKAFRRDLTADDIAGLKAVYMAARDIGTDGDVGDRFATGLSWVARAIVQSPDFLYLTELGDPAVANGAKTTITSDEIASALSYSVVGLPPDDELVAAAAASQLADADARGAQVARLIAAYPDAWQQQMRQFVPQWLGINFGKTEWQKDTDALPMFSASLRSALQTEIDMLIDDWAVSSDGALVDVLLTSPTGFINSVNAPLYGMSASGATFQKTALDPTQRAGILTLGGFLGSASHVDETSPTMRGKVILQKFFCAEPPAPPANVPPLPPVDQSAPTTTRARFAAHLADDTCKGCHGFFDPMGNAFEGYDALGAFRTEENGFPVDTSGSLVGAAGGDKPVANAIELVNLLAASPQTHECVTRQLFRFTVGRVEAPFDGCMISEAAQAMGSGPADLRQAITKIVRSDSFVVRTVNKE
jgi:hypothetical protein